MVSWGGTSSMTAIEPGGSREDPNVRLVSMKGVLSTGCGGHEGHQAKRPP